MSRVTRDPRINTCEGFYNDQDPTKAPSSELLNFVADKAAGKRLLDIGCGIGAYSYELNRRGFDCYGVDANADYVKIASNSGCRAQVSDSGHLPFADDFFDTAFALEVFEHLSDEVLDLVLHEAARCTKRRLLVTVPDNEQYTALLDHGFLFGHFHAVDHVQFFTRESLSAFLGRAFRSVTVVRGGALYPHRLLPAVVRRPLSLGYRLGLLKPAHYSRLFAVAEEPYVSQRQASP